MPIPFVWHPRSRRHVPEVEYFAGVRRAATESPERVEQIRNALVAAKHPEVNAIPQDDEILLQVHDADLVNHLKSAWDAWQVAGLNSEPGQDRVIPTVIPNPEFMHGLPFRGRQSIAARAGRFCYDTRSLIAQGTWDAARASVDVAQTAADLVLQGEHAVYALTRPPGHNAMRSSFGNSCYLNNAAIAVETLLDGFDRVAVIDVDAHHGNGTQSMFYDRGDVFYGSLHVDPSAGWFPYFVGLADELGRGEGEGANLNVVLPTAAGDDLWLSGIARLRHAVEDFGAEALVVSYGTDAHVDDPTAPLKVTVDGFAKGGELIAGLDLPTLVVQEGGCHIKTIGDSVTRFLDAWG